VKDKIQLFEERNIRTLWDETQEVWYFSVVDVCGALTESVIPRNYWSDLKRRLKKEGNQLHEKIVQLKMLSTDGKSYMTDAMKIEDILFLIQSIPSKKTQRFKMWIAKIASQRLTELAAPKLPPQLPMEEEKRNFKHRKKLAWLICGLLAVLSLGLTLVALAIKNRRNAASSAPPL